MTDNEIKTAIRGLKEEIGSLQSRLSKLEHVMRTQPSKTIATALAARKEPLPVAIPSRPANLDASKWPLVTIECDGGTSCNVTGRYGNGYGSFSIDGGPVIRRNFIGGHSCNSAEVMIMVEALHELESMNNGKPCRVLVRSDSRNALKWVQSKPGVRQIISKAASPAYIEAVKQLLAIRERFPYIKGEWRGRAESVRLFGH